MLITLDHDLLLVKTGIFTINLNQEHCNNWGNCRQSIAACKIMILASKMIENSNMGGIPQMFELLENGP